MLAVLERMEHSFSQQWKARAAVALPFDQFQLGHLALDHPVVDRPRETGSHRVFVFFVAGSERLQFGNTAFRHSSQPGI
jgi:hypothetical protein